MPFPSVHSRRGFERRYLRHLVLHGAVLFHRGRKLVDPERYLELVLDLALQDSLARVEQALRPPGPRQQTRVDPLIESVQLRQWVLYPDAAEIALREANGGTFSLTDAAQRCLGVSPSTLTRSAQTRLGIALHAIGCQRIERRTQRTRYVYCPPQEAGISGASVAPSRSLSAFGASPPIEMGPRLSNADNGHAFDGAES